MGLGLATRGVQRHHQLAHEPRTTWLTGDQALELGNRFGVIAELQQPLESLLGGDQAELLEPFHLGARPPLLDEVEVRTATPDAQRTLIHRDRHSTRLDPELRQAAARSHRRRPGRRRRRADSPVRA